MRLAEKIKRGYKELSPLQLARAKHVGIVGQMVGLKLGMVVLWWQGFGYWVFFLAFTLFIMILELIQVQQQIGHLESFEKYGVR